MRIKKSKWMMTLLLLTMCLTVLAPAAFAEETRSIEIPVTVSLIGPPPTDDEVYEINLQADSPDYPMPKGSENGMYHMSITGENTVKLPKIEFSTVGIYTYTIFQSPGTNELTNYDDTAYNLFVYVTNAEDGSGLETTVILYLLGETDKLSEVIFKNEYEKEAIATSPKKPEPPKTSDDTMIWPYVVLFISGAALLFIVGMTVKKKGIHHE